MIWTKHARFGWTLSTYVSQLFIAISLARKSHNNTNTSRECEHSLFWSCTSSLNVFGVLNQQRKFYGLEYIQKLTGACIACVAECGLLYGLSHTHTLCVYTFLQYPISWRIEKNFLCFQPNGVWYEAKFIIPIKWRSWEKQKFCVAVECFYYNNYWICLLCQTKRADYMKSQGQTTVLPPNWLSLRNIKMMVNW